MSFDSSSSNDADPQESNQIQGGWDLSLFTADQTALDSLELLCSICSHVFRQPQLLIAQDSPGCQHSFCRSCLDLWKQTSPSFRCPLCRTPITRRLQDKVVERRCAQLEVCCPRAECTEKGVLGRTGEWLLKHVQKCEYGLQREELFGTVSESSFQEEFHSGYFEERKVEEVERVLKKVERARSEDRRREQNLMQTIVHQHALWELQKRELLLRIQQELCMFSEVISEESSSQEQLLEQLQRFRQRVLQSCLVLKSRH